MAPNPRRFRVWPRWNVSGQSRVAAYAEGVLFTDGTVALRWTHGSPTSVIFPEHGLDAVRAGVGFGGEAEIEWLDGAHG